MTTKKEILDCIKSIAEHQDLIATNQNTERKAESITTQRLLAEIFRELQSIKNILEDAAKEPQPAQEDKPEREVIRLKDAAPLLGGLRNKSFNAIKMGIPLFKGNGTNQYLTEADSARLVLKYKI